MMDLLLVDGKKKNQFGSRQLLGRWMVVLFSRRSYQGDELASVTAPSLPLCYGDQVMLNLGLRQCPGGVDGQVKLSLKHFPAGGL